MNGFKFWQSWLVGAGVYLVLLGIVLALLPNSAVVDFVFNRQIDCVFWPDGELPGEVLKYRGWLYGVLGATIAGWGILIVFIASGPFRKKEKWSRNAIASAFLLWYFVDTTISVFYNVWFNVVFNTLLFAVVALPLLFTWKAFKE